MDEEYISSVARRTRSKQEAYIKQKHNQLIQQGIFSSSRANKNCNFNGLDDASIVVIDDDQLTQSTVNEEGDSIKGSNRKSQRRKGRGKEIEIEGEQDRGQHDGINDDNNDCLTAKHGTHTPKRYATIGSKKSILKSSEGVGSPHFKNEGVVGSTLARLVDYSSDSSTSNEEHESNESNSSSYALSEDSESDSDSDSDDVMDCADSDFTYEATGETPIMSLKPRTRGKGVRHSQLTSQSSSAFSKKNPAFVKMDSMNSWDSVSSSFSNNIVIDLENNFESQKYSGPDVVIENANSDEKKRKRNSKIHPDTNVDSVEVDINGVKIMNSTSTKAGSKRKFNASLGEDLVKSRGPSQRRKTSTLNDHSIFKESVDSVTEKGVVNEQKQANPFLPIDDNPLLLRFSLKDDDDPPEKTEHDNMVEDLFREMALGSSVNVHVPSEENRSELSREDEEEETHDAPLGQDTEKSIGPQKTQIHFRRKNPWPVDDIKEKTKRSTQRTQTNASNDYNIFEEFVDSVMDKGMINEQKQANPFLLVDDDPLPLKFSFKDEVDLPEETEYENMVDDLFAEMAFAETCDKICPITNVPSEENRSGICREDMHRLVLDEEVGLICTICHVVVQEIRYVMPPFKMSEYTMSESEKDFCQKNGTISGGLAVENQMDDSIDCKEYNSNGTVWDMVPSIHDNIYPHQAEGLEFIWRNLEGTILLNELKDNNTSNGVGGCIISHAPGTGKTRLAIVFIETYLKVFPKCRPIIIAPSSMLLTWEEEFKKWRVNFPFHILNKSEYSGKESEQAFNDLWKSNNTAQEKMRMVKLHSWYNNPSILGVSYNLYEKLANNTNSSGWGKLLLDAPCLVILDEGHTPRNERSQIWNTLLKLNTKKRIILSGTPFQNNFGELFNTLNLVRPAIMDSLAKDETFVVAKRKYSKKKSPQANNETPFNGSSGIWDASIKKLKEVIAPFVHVHTGSILRESLPGLMDSVIILNPGSFQKQIIDRIEITQNQLQLEHKLALVLVHPSLLSCCTLSAKEESVISIKELKKVALNPSMGVKTRFIMELIRLSSALNEKVLIFSQYIDPLALVKDHLKEEFQWDEGKEVFHMQGKMDQKTRQRIIDDFNNPKSDAKVLLASIKCCSEGINLVGASRVVLLDVVWNPSVERQAISRAYRLGQKKVVYTYHLIIAGTTEGGKLYRQAEKGWLSERVFSSNSKEKDNNDDHNKRNNAQLLNDKVLEALCENNNLKEIFEKIFQPQEAELIESFGLGM